MEMVVQVRPNVFLGRELTGMLDFSSNSCRGTVCVCVCVRIRVCVACTCMYPFLRVCARVDVCVPVCRCVHVCAHIQACLCVHVCPCVHYTWHQYPPLATNRKNISAGSKMWGCRRVKISSGQALNPHLRCMGSFVCTSDHGPTAILPLDAFLVAT